MVSSKPKAGLTRRRKSTLSLVIVLLLMAICIFLALNGFGRGWMIRYMRPWTEAVNLGLDLNGGVYALYQATIADEANADSAMDETVRLMKDRFTAMGLAEASVVRQGQSHIRVEAAVGTEVSQIIGVVATKGNVTFEDADGNVIINNSHFKQVAVGYDKEGNPALSFELTAEGRKLFADGTTANVGKQITMKLDGEVISSAGIETPITEGMGSVTTGLSLAGTGDLVMLIQSGALPLALTQTQSGAITATLGDNALNTVVWALTITVALAMVILLVRYRLSGLAVDLSLVIYVLAVVFLLAVTGAQLTLPGIAGIVLGFILAFDAHVVIFQRFHQEVALGKNLRAALKGGLKNARPAIMDTHLTVIIIALVLLAMGVGAVKSFAGTLLISTIASLVTSLVVSRGLLKTFLNLDILNDKLYLG